MSAQYGQWETEEDFRAWQRSQTGAEGPTWGWHHHAVHRANVEGFWDGVSAGACMAATVLGFAFLIWAKWQGL